MRPHIHNAPFNLVYPTFRCPIGSIGKFIEVTIMSISLHLLNRNGIACSTADTVLDTDSISSVMCEHDQISNDYQYITAEAMNYLKS